MGLRLKIDSIVAVFSGKTLDFTSPLSLETCKQRLEKDLSLNIFESRQEWLRNLGNVYTETELFEKNAQLIEFRVVCGFSKINRVVGIQGFLHREGDKIIVSGKSFVTKSHKAYHSLILLWGFLLILLGLQSPVFLLFGAGFIFAGLRGYIYTVQKYQKILLEEIEEKLES